MNQRFCMYCSRWRDPNCFTSIVDHKSGSKRGMCQPCQEMRKRPHAELVELAEKQKLMKKERLK